MIACACTGACTRPGYRGPCLPKPGSLGEYDRYRSWASLDHWYDVIRPQLHAGGVSVTSPVTELPKWFR